MTTTLKTISLFQPWASLVVIGAKPIEFRGWDYRVRYRHAVKPGQRIGIASSMRKVDEAEVRDLLDRLDDEINSTALIADRARQFLLGLVGDVKFQPPLGMLLCTVRLGEPKLSSELKPEWASVLADSDRLEHCKWAWPVDEVRVLDEPHPVRGARGFFNVQIEDGAI
jgi:hypothetical protein